MITVHNRSPISFSSISVSLWLREKSFLRSNETARLPGPARFAEFQKVFRFLTATPMRERQKQDEDGIKTMIATEATEATEVRERVRKSDALVGTGCRHLAIDPLFDGHPYRPTIKWCTQYCAKRGYRSKKQTTKGVAPLKRL